MLFLTFKIGRSRYALDTAAVVEVLPLVRAKELPRALEGVCGVLNYHGRPLPLVDLSALATGRPARATTSTRIVVVRVANSGGPGGDSRLLGLVAEHATGLIRRGAAEFERAPLVGSGATAFGGVTTDAGDIVQRVEPARLLSADLLRQLEAGEGEEPS